MIILRTLKGRIEINHFEKKIIIVTGFKCALDKELLAEIQSILISIQSQTTIPISYSQEQKHVLLFRKSALRGFYKLRHVTK